jgi:PAS domain S-box-containing protein
LGNFFTTFWLLSTSLLNKFTCIFILMKPGARFLNSLFEIAHVEFQTYDLCDKKLLFSSGVAHQLLGYSADEYFNLSTNFYKEIIYPDDFKKVEETLEKIKASKKGDVIEMTIRVRRSDGFYIWIYSRQMILEKKNKKGVCQIIREVEDVTKLVELQNELRGKVEQLKVISFKNSHLLRNPVASIIGLVNIIEEHDDIASEHNRQILHFLKEAIMKLDHVIHEINDIARLD